MCRSVSLQIKKSAFQNHRAILERLRPEDFRQASKEEIDRKPYSNAGIRLLRKNLRAVRTRIQGTDESRLSMRSKVWSTVLLFNPPSLWITINPADTQDPIAQVIAGADIDLDKFCRMSGPNSQDRAITMAQDPYAAAKFFHSIIRILLETVFGISKTKYSIHRKEGAYGTVQAYLGTVEAQGRGSLHMHMLVWLKDAPTAKVMQLALQHDQFRQRVVDFIKSTIHADIDGMDTDGLLTMPKETCVSYSRPVDPITDRKGSDKHEKTLARALQFHECNTRTCLRWEHGCLHCKRGAPFSCSSEAWVNEMGEWGPRRICPKFNSWNGTTMRCCRSNHDCKLIMNGCETCVAMLYNTNYAFKKQNKSSNATALIADSFAFTWEQEKKDDSRDGFDLNKKLLQHCANSLFSEREFSAPEIISYLMGWEDRFELHFYVNIYWDAAMASLKTAFPCLTAKQ